jgi:phosphatidylserine synthase
MGLTISTAGATLTLAVLSDIAFTRDIFPNLSFIPLIIGLAALMVSKIAFPSFAWFFSRRRLSYLIVLVFGASVVVLPSVANAWLLLTGSYIGVGLARASILAIRE